MPAPFRFARVPALRTLSAGLILTAGFALTGFALTGCALPEDLTGPDQAVATGTGPGGLTVAADTHADSYQRDAFGQRWKDIDHNGCGQRNDVLARDLTGIRSTDRCAVVSGTLVDPYTGERVTFAKARASEVQIDHIVALADAWRSGAWAWTDERRELFANDFDEIQASSAAANRAKSDHDAATWSPEGADRSCTWARQVVEIKTHWGLSVDPDEAAGLATMLAACPA